MQKVPYTVKDCARDDEKSIVVPPLFHVRVKGTYTSWCPITGTSRCGLGRLREWYAHFLAFCRCSQPVTTVLCKKAPAKCAVPFNALGTSIAQSPKLVNCFFAQNAPGNFDSPNLPKWIHSPKSQNVVLHQL